MSQPTLDFAAILNETAFAGPLAALDEQLTMFGDTATAAADVASAALDRVAASADVASVSTERLATSAAASSVGLDAGAVAADVNTVSADANAAATDKASASQGLFGTASEAAGKKLMLFGLVGAAAVALIAVKTISMAGDFQAGMTTLVTGAGEAQSNIKMVSAGVLQMAVDTGTSTKQLTDGLYMIESAGFHGAAGLDVLKSAAEGAKVGNAALADVANGVTTEMVDYASSNISAAYATNDLIATVAAGKTHLQDLANAMSTILPTSSNLKVSLTDTSGALATMTGEGTDAASAATYLRQLLMALASPAHAGAAALKGIGLTTQEVSDEMKVSLPGTLTMIMDHLKATYKEGSPAYVTALKNIAGGSKQMQGVLELSGSHLKTFKDNVSNITAAVNKGGKSITGWSDVQNDFNFKVDKAKAVVETLGIKIGTGLLPVVGNMVDIFSKNVVPLLQHAAEFFAHNHDAVAILAGAIGGLFVAAALAAAAAAWTFLAPILVAAAPFILVGAAIALVVLHGKDLLNFFQSSNPAALAVKAVMLLLLGTFIALKAEAIMGLVAAIPGLIAGLGASVAAFVAQTIAAGAAAIAVLAATWPFIAVGAAIGAVIGIIILMITHWKQVMEAVKSVGHVFEALTGTIDLQTKLAATKAKEHADQMKINSITAANEQRMKVVENLRQEREGILKELAATTDPAKKHALEMRLGVVNHSIAMREEAIAAANEQKVKIAKHMADLKKQAIEEARQIKIGWQGRLGEMIGNVLGQIGGFVGMMLGKLGDLKDKAVLKIIQFGAGIVNEAEKLPGQFLTVGEHIIEGIITGITNKVGDAINAVKNAAGNILNGAKNFLGIHSPSQRFADEVGLPAMQGIAAGITRNQHLPHGAMASALGGMPGLSGGAGLALGRGNLALGGAGGASGDLHIHAHFDASIGMVDPRTRQQAAQWLVEDVSKLMTRRGNQQRNVGAGYTGV